MKKLMMAAAIVCAAACAHAGAANWSVSNLPSSPAGAIIADTTKYSAYLFIGSDVSAATDLLTGKATDMAAFKELSVASRDATANSKGMINFGNVGYGSYADQDVSAFAIILDTSVENMAKAKNYMVAKVNGTGDEVITKHFTTAGNQPFSWGNQQSTTANTWTSIAPEPTSGLLLLIGVAGLALRRRRA